MRTILVSDEVWKEIANRGRFGETEEDVLRRTFELDPLEDHERQEFVAASTGGRRGRGAARYATKRMSAKVVSDRLIVEFADGERHQWDLPYPTDKQHLRRVRNEAVQFALDNGASDPGQTNTVKKALTDAGYHLTK